MADARRRDSILKKKGTRKKKEAEEKGEKNQAGGEPRKSLFSGEIGVLFWRTQNCECTGKNALRAAI